MCANYARTISGGSAFHFLDWRTGVSKTNKWCGSDLHFMVLEFQAFWGKVSQDQWLLLTSLTSQIGFCLKDSIGTPPPVSFEHTLCFCWNIHCLSSIICASVKSTPKIWISLAKAADPREKEQLSRTSKRWFMQGGAPPVISGFISPLTNINYRYITYKP